MAAWSTNEHEYMNQSSPFKSRGGFHRLLNALRYSAQGLYAACRHEAAFRQELLALAVITPLALWVGRTPLESLLLVSCWVLVLIVELVNSAIEALADSVTLDHHPLIGRAKDLCSAAVLLTIGLASVVWLVVLADIFWT